MAQVRVEDFPLAVFFHPRDGDLVGLFRYGIGHVEAHQHVNFFRLPVLVLVDFVLDRILRRRLVAAGGSVVDGDRDGFAGAPGMAVERAADHVPVRLRYSGTCRWPSGYDEAVPLLLEPVVEEVIERLLDNAQSSALACKRRRCRSF